MQVVELKPDWAKGYSRVGAAHLGLGDADAAIKTYEKGVPAALMLNFCWGRGGIAKVSHAGLLFF